MRILLFILLFSFQSFGQTVAFLPIYSSGGGSFSPTVSGIIEDDGKYNGFPQTDTLNNGNIFCIYKKSFDHAGAGYVMFNQTDDGGTTNTEHAIIVDGDTIQAAAYSLGIIRSSGRVLLAYQDDETYTFTKFAYSDDNGVTFTQTDSLWVGASVGISPSPIKMQVMPSGKILMGYYKGFYGGFATIGFIESTDSGINWNFGDSIYRHEGTGYGDDLGYEFAFVVTDSTGVDSTTKMIAFVRNADVAYYMHYYSANGGVTWNTSFTEDSPGGYSRHYLYNFGGSSNQSPVDLIVHNDSIYVANGYRNQTTGVFQLQTIKTTKANAYTNNFYNWSAVDTLRNYNASTLGSDIDCGYPVFFHDRQGKLWVRDYDVSTEPLNPAIAADRCWIYQYKIAD